MNTQYLQTDKGKIAYDDAGAGVPVILVPGMGVLRSEYRLLAPQLISAGFRVITMDLRGHGESDARWNAYSIEEMGTDILALIRHIDAGPAVVVGHSFSAGSAVWAAVEAPDLVRGLVMLGPVVRGEVGAAMRTLMTVLFARPWGPQAWLMYYGKLFPTRKPADWETYTAVLKKNLSEPGRLESLKKLMLEPKTASDARLPRISMPALVIMGSKDPDFKDPAHEAKWIAEQVKGSYEIIEDAGHYPQTEMPEITGKLVTTFLEKFQTGAHDAENTQ